MGCVGAGLDQSEFCNFIFALLLEIQHNSGAHVVILAHSVIAKKERHILTPFNMPLCFT